MFYQKGKTNLDLTDAIRRQWVTVLRTMWITCKSAPRSRQITTSAPHHSIFSLFFTTVVVVRITVYHLDLLFKMNSIIFWWQNNKRCLYSFHSSDLTSFHVTSADLISSELSALWWVAATANWVVRREPTQFALGQMKRGQIRFGQTMLSWCGMNDINNH